MGGWETVVAACGGLVLGIGIGITIARRLDRSNPTVRRMESLIRNSVIPVLEVRAERLGLSREERGRDTGDPLELAVQLSQRIQRLEEKNNMAFSDTVEVSRSEFNSDLAKTQNERRNRAEGIE